MVLLAINDRRHASTGSVGFRSVAVFRPSRRLTFSCKRAHCHRFGWPVSLRSAPFPFSLVLIGPLRLLAVVVPRDVVMYRGAAGRVTHGRGFVFAGSDSRPVTTRPYVSRHPSALLHRLPHRGLLVDPSASGERLRAKCHGLARPGSWIIRVIPS